MDNLAREPSTVSDIIALPEGVRAELIGGIIYNMATPSRRHQDIVGAVYFRLKSYLSSCGGSCEVYVSPFAVYLFDDEYHYFEPDIFVVCDKDKLKEDGCHGAPDLVIEVLSPGTRSKDLGIKLFKYRDAGVRECWMIDPTKNMITAWDFTGEEELAEVYGFDEEAHFFLFPEVKFQLDTLLY